MVALELRTSIARRHVVRAIGKRVWPVALLSI